MWSKRFKKFTVLALTVIMLISTSAACMAAEGAGSQGKEQDADTQQEPTQGVTVGAGSPGAVPGEGEGGEDLTPEEPEAKYALKGGDGVHEPYMQGSEGKFNPDGRLTRAEACQLLYRLVEDPGEQPEDYPEDVVRGAWYSQSVAWMTGEGILDLIDGLAKPDEEITRGAFTAMVTRLITDAKPVRDPIFFFDVPDDHMYADEIDLASSYGWVAGSEYKFRPDDGITRAEAVTVINRVRGAVPDKEFMKDMLVSRFSDVFAGHWAYYDIMEATLSHTHAGGVNSGAWSDVDLTPVKRPGGLWFVGLDYYYIDPATGMPIAGTTRGGLTFGADGRYTSGDATIDKYVKDVLSTITKESMTQEEKLHAAYNYTRDSFTYLRRNYYEMGDVSWAAKEATTMFSTKRGNCYCYSSVFYFLAKQLGYDAVLISGKVNNNNPVPHAWVEIAENGEYFMYDPELEMSYRVKGTYYYDFYHMAYNKTPWRYWR